MSVSTTPVIIRPSCVSATGKDRRASVASSKRKGGSKQQVLPHEDTLCEKTLRKALHRWRVEESGRVELRVYGVHNAPEPPGRVLGARARSMQCLELGAFYVTRVRTTSS